MGAGEPCRGVPFRTVTWSVDVGEDAHLVRDSLPAGLVRSLRKDLGVTSERLAELLGVRQASVSAMEKSERTGKIQLDTLERALASLGFRLTYGCVAFVPTQGVTPDDGRAGGDMIGQ